MSSTRVQRLRHGAAPLLLSLGCASIGCTASPYDPEPQFWPNLGPVSFGIGSDGSDAGAGTSSPGFGAADGDEDEPSAGDGRPGSGGSAGAGNSVGGANTPARGSSTGGGPATSGGASGGSSAMAAGGATGSAGSGATGSTGSTATVSATCSLSVSVTTTAPGGRYQPRNVGAIWIADDTGLFIKSLDVWGNRRLSHVTAWNAATRAAGVPGNKVDAVSSATLTAHRTHNVSWNCEDYNGQVVPDGSYRVYFEVTDSNNSGPNHFETFTKGSTAATLQGSATNFNGIVLTFTP